MINNHDRVRIAARAIVCERTVAQVYRGRGREYSRLRVAAAARELGLPEPPDRSTGSLGLSLTPSPNGSKSA
jgi:hypothetical protein